METTCLGVLLTDPLSYAKDVERAELTFLNNSTHHITNLVLCIKMFCYMFSDYMQYRFIVLKPGIKTFQYLIIRLSNVYVEETFTIVIMSVLSR